MSSKADSWLLRTLGYAFAEPRLMTQALTHRSAGSAHNERLEFLGDAVLDVVISEFIFRAQPFAAEGDLSRLRASLVNDESLATLADDLGLGQHLILGGGERKAGGHRRVSILANALEALFGAVYLDGGFDAARTLIEHAYGDRLDSLPDLDELRDPKTRLQEWLQARGLALPVYAVKQVTGAAHSQTFEVECTLGDDYPVTTASAATRRRAEQAAARKMLDELANPGAEP